MIIATLSVWFPNFTFLIKKPCSRSTAEKQGKNWWLVARWCGGGSNGEGSVIANFGGFLDWLQVVSSGFGWFHVVSGWFRTVSDGFRLVTGCFGWFQVVCYFSSYQHKHRNNFALIFYTANVCLKNKFLLKLSVFKILKLTHFSPVSHFYTPWKR